MRIRKVNKKLYSDSWPEIRLAVGERSGNRCEGSPEYPDCRVKNGDLHSVTGSKVVLTVAHLDHDPTNNDDFEETMEILSLKKSNFRHWCQRCHNTYDAPMRRRGINERKYKKQLQFLFNYGGIK
ncbi:hypothetical protein KAH94_05875 [bacterium]|nr:hypothetical protein [bacterium]